MREVVTGCSEGNWEEIQEIVASVASRPIFSQGVRRALQAENHSAQQIFIALLGCALVRRGAGLGPSMIDTSAVPR